MMVYTLPIIAALLGWFTNYIAVKMLFHPREPISLYFFELQGVFPKRQAVIAEKLGKMVVDELFSAKDLRDKISNPDSLEKIYDSIEEKVDDYLRDALPNKFPVMSLFIREKTRNNIKEEMLAEVERITPTVINKYLDDMEQQLDIQEIVRSKVAELSPQKLEGLINSIISKEFRFIEIIGAVIGFLVGCIQIVLMQFF